MITILPLPRSFFDRATLLVAQELLGHHLIIQPTDSTQSPQRFRVVETEAYTQMDPACHAYQKRSGRAANLYNRPGLAYVYFIYGMHHCLNVITEAKGTAGAVLFRALEPLDPNLAHLKTHGPGRLTRALGITQVQHNAMDLTQDCNPLYLAHGEPSLPENRVQTTRIGISKAQDYPWRFYIKDNPWISVK